MESIYLFFHQIFSREEIFHLWIVFCQSVQTDQTGFSHQSDRYDWSIKGPMTFSLQNSPTLGVSLSHEELSVPRSSPWRFEFFLPGNLDFKWGFGAPLLSKLSPILS
jgi:hypothetical protein